MIENDIEVPGLEWMFWDWRGEGKINMRLVLGGGEGAKKVVLERAVIVGDGVLVTTAGLITHQACRFRIDVGILFVY